MSSGTMLAATMALAWLCLCRTWLRWAAILPACAGIVLARQGELPIAVISEDARQMAVIGDDGALHLNRTRPNGFNLEQWQMAYAARAVTKPVTADDPFFKPRAGMDNDGAMRCNDMACTARVRHASGASVDLAILTKPPTETPSTEDLCQRFDLIVLAYAPSNSPCGDGTLVLTAQDLALRGSAEVMVARHASGAPELTARHAIGASLRPWHDHRQWSRAARNLAERN